MYTNSDAAFNLPPGPTPDPPKPPPAEPPTRAERVIAAVSNVAAMLRESIADPANQKQAVVCVREAVNRARLMPAEEVIGLLAGATAHALGGFLETLAAQLPPLTTPTPTEAK